MVVLLLHRPWAIQLKWAEKCTLKHPLHLIWDPITKRRTDGERVE